MNIFDYCSVLEDRGEEKLLEFKGTAHLIEDMEGEEEYWVKGVNGETEEDLLSYVKTFPNGVYHLHTYSSMITTWNKEEGILWEEYDSDGTVCDTVEVKDGSLMYIH